MGRHCNCCQASLKQVHMHHQFCCLDVCVLPSGHCEMLLKQGIVSQPPQPATLGWEHSPKMGTQLGYGNSVP